MSKLIYLACPFSHKDELVRLDRVQKADQYTAYLISCGNIVFSPVTHSFRVARYLPPKYLLNHEFWMKQDIPILKRCDELYILALNGWEQSKGVIREINAAITFKIPFTIKTWNNKEFKLWLKATEGL